ncbi:MAG: diguanylate cyclase [Candidatus Korobacteraceae bacterium]
MRVLVADDSSLYRTMLQRLLEPWGYQVVLAASGYDAQRILENGNPPQLALLDCLMPGLSVFDLCQRIRTRNHNLVYTILLSPDDQQSNVLKAFELGADDYLCKPLNHVELRTRLKAGEIILRSREQTATTPVELNFEHSRDALRIWCRGAILDLLSSELSRANRTPSPLSVLLTDLDFLHRVNGGGAIPAGDDVLRDAADAISGAVRHCDHVGRYENEQFLVVLPNCVAGEAREVAERVWYQISKKPAMAEAAMTVSFGLSQWRPGQGVDEFLYQADVALQRAKHNGRYRVEVENSAPEAPKQDFGNPSQLQNEMRRIVRSGFNRRLRVRAMHEGKPTLLHGRIGNISPEGIGAIIPCSLQVSEQVTLTFAMENGPPSSVSAVVRHCQGLRSGFQFISIQPSLREAIARICG